MDKQQMLDTAEQFRQHLLERAVLPTTSAVTCYEALTQTHGVRLPQHTTVVMAAQIIDAIVAFLRSQP